MNKYLKFILIFFGVIFCLLLIGRITKMLEYYTVPTVSNYPSLKKGSLFLASNLKKPERFDMICYKSETEEYGKQVWIHRICGIGGDKVEIKDGVLYVNNQTPDDSLPIARNYILNNDQQKIIGDNKLLNEEYLVKSGRDSIEISLPVQLLDKLKIGFSPSVLDKYYTDPQIANAFSKPWNQDHFGPVIVPPGKYFIIGDNRENAFDSRYQGFIDESKYVSTLIWIIKD